MGGNSRAGIVGKGAVVDVAAAVGCLEAGVGSWLAVVGWVFVVGPGLAVELATADVGVAFGSVDLAVVSEDVVEVAASAGGVAICD